MIKKVNRKAMTIRHSGRSSDYITPSFGYGCLYKCAYCYMRRNTPHGVTIAQNTSEILSAIIKHHSELPKKKPNQTHDKLWTYDISCNEDFALHLKYHDWKYILNSLISNDIFPTFATKYVNNDLLDYNPERKARIRFSLMPQLLSTVLEPNTSKIKNRLIAIRRFYEAGWDVHVNFSPVIINSGTKNLYIQLFKDLNFFVPNTIKKNIKAEVIMLTHNEAMHKYNLLHNPRAENLLWQPERQELKKSSYQKTKSTLRYSFAKKRTYIKQFKKIHSEIIPWNEIRYIF